MRERKVLILQLVRYINELGMTREENMYLNATYRNLSTTNNILKHEKNTLVGQVMHLMLDNDDLVKEVAKLKAEMKALG